LHLGAGAAVLLVLWLPWLALGLNSWRYLRRPRLRTPDYTPVVALIAPCRGVDQGFEGNVRAVLSQDYPNYRVVFVTGTVDDPAYPVLAHLVREHPHARLLIAGPAHDRGQKVHNLLAGVASSPEAEVLAFVDSDVRPHPTWLRSLTAPLGKPEVGGTSGYVRYRPERGGVWSWARAYGAGISALSMAHSGNRSLWGGAMAVRRETFERADVTRAWQHALSDDAVLARQIDRLGLKLVFVPECLADAFEECDLAGF
jgi:cellulose synthase/poly-beta-1,6-N-acetylglucosamine synthase-like glycosyltransferase